MFTGIVDHYGKIVDWVNKQKASQCWIETQFSDLQLGESIAVDGICLTVDAIKENRFRCDISPETMAVTTANQFAAGRFVNLERALRLTDRLSGHFVTGHVDHVVQVLTKTHYTDYVEYRFTMTQQAAHSLLVPKGSVAINGVSLTLNEVNENDFSVMLIPHTLQRTNLGQLQEGEQVNIEYDYLAKLVAHQVQTITEQ